MTPAIFRKKLQVIRKGDGSYQNFKWVDGELQNLEIEASVQPTPADVLLTLPEGFRTKSTYTLYTDTKLRTAEVDKNNPDIVVIDSERYQVVRIAAWQNDVISHYEVLVVQEGTDAH